jgi:hypothetical protein
VSRRNRSEALGAPTRSSARELTLLSRITGFKSPESFKMQFLRDRRAKIADLCSDILPTYRSIIDHKRNLESLPYLHCDVASITGYHSRSD